MEKGQLPHLCSAQGSKLVIFFMSSAKLCGTARMKVGLIHFLAFVVLYMPSKSSPIHVPTAVFNSTFMHLWFMLFLCFQTKQPRLPDNDIKAAGELKDKVCLTAETTCWYSNSLQIISRWCSWFIAISLVMCINGCCPVVAL